MNRRLALLTAAAALVATPAFAGAVGRGTIIGVFDNVVTSGSVVNTPALGDSTSYVNGPSNATQIVNSTDPMQAGTPPLQATGSKLQWGSSSTGVAPEDSFSELIFFGAPIAAITTQPFRIGRLTYLNGTSDLGTLIFGADISFYANSVDQADYLGTDHLYITTTSNLGQSVAQDADWINICGNGSNICNTRIEADEDSEGGTGVTVDLFGQFVGDPTLQLTSAALAPGQDPAINGFLAPGPQLAVSEPAGWAVLGSALALLGLGRRRGGPARRHQLAA